MSVPNQDSRSQSRFRLAPFQSSENRLPPGEPIDGSLLATPAEGMPLPACRSEGYLQFQAPLSYASLASLRFRTAGFEVDTIEGIPESAESEPPIPPAAEVPVAVTFQPAGIPAAKIVQESPPVQFVGFDLAPAHSGLATVRKRIRRGPDPNAAKRQPVTATPIEKPAPAIAVKHVPPPVSKSATQPVVQKPVPAVTVKPVAPASKPAGPTVVKPAAKPEPTVVKPAAAAITEQAPKPAAPQVPSSDKLKINIRPAQPSQGAPSEKRQAPSRPPIAARDHGNAVPVERDEPVAEPAPKPKLLPIRKGDIPPPLSKPAEPAAEVPLPVLGGVADSDGFWANASGAVKAGVIAAALVVVVGGAALIFSGAKGSTQAAGAGAGARETTAGSVIGGGGWSTSWGADTPVNKTKQISIYRPSATMSDYRFEFRGSIERKAIGWIFRAKDPKNYYVGKLEVIKPGLNPVVALIKYPVINGKEGTRTQVMLPEDIKTRLDTVYQVRLDVKGTTFTTYIQDKRVDVWSDDQIPAGGVGFYTDKTERAQIKSSQVAYLN